MRTFKVGAAAVLVSVFLAACGGSPIVNYNNDTMDGLNTIKEATTTMFEELTKEFDKGPNADIARFDQLVNEGTSKSREAIAKVRGLTAPAGEAVKEFSAAVAAYLAAVEEILKLNGEFVAAVKVKNATKAQQLANTLMPKFENADALSEKIIQAQKVMAEKNNFTLE